MNEIKIFENEQFGKVRTLEIENEIYFVGKDVAEILGYTNTRKALIDHVDEEDKRDGVTIRDSIGREQTPTCINESGLYNLILSSKLPQAKAFKRWVTHEVLPSIRKHGAYMTDEVLKEALTSPDFLIKLATELKEEREKRIALEIDNNIKAQQIGELKPKADYVDKILKSKSLMNVSQIAKDYGMSATKFNKILHELKVQYKQAEQWLLYSKYHDKGYTHSEIFDFENKNGINETKLTTKWTNKGRLFLYNLLKDNGYLPLIEMEK
nr:MAG TPA: repressor domain protein [Caudoviricetes sp.]